ncbi:MAG TPA: hypothetical protein VK447_16970 [Myxococcaceae bacterium]|nr:hypothetical protein [Myxococcaceae bacterium]
MGAWLVLLASPPVAAAEPEEEETRSDIGRAVFTDGWLWLLTDTGALSRISDGGKERLAEALPDPARDMCPRQSSLLVITAPEKKPGLWTIRRRAEGAWTVLGTVKTRGDELVAMLCEPERVTLLTSRRLVELTGGTERSVPLKWKKPMSLVTSVHATREAIFTGFNFGEWGGGLLRIDRATGKVTPLERNASGKLCGGPLNTKCDPVHAIADEPWKPDCVVAAVGLVHMFPHGRLVEVCGNTIERLYFKPFGKDDARKDAEAPNAEKEPFSTVAFFGLVRSGDALLAVGIDGIHRLRDKGAVELTPLPDFKKIGGVAVSFELPDVILVLTSINQRASLSGRVPMLVPR